MASNTETARAEVILNGQKANATLKELDASARALKASIGNIDTTSKEFIEGSKKLQDVKNRIKQINDEVKATGASFGEMMRKAYDESIFGKLQKAWLGVSAGIAAAAGVLKVAKDAFTSNEEGINKWKVVVTQAEGAYQVLLTTIKTGDWSNFLQNIGDAIKEGERYQEVLNELEKKQRGLGGRVAQRSAEAERLKLQARTQKDESGNDVSKDTAIGYGTQALNLEKANLEDIQRIQKEKYDNDVFHIKSVTGLQKDQIEDYILEYGVNDKLLQQSKDIVQNQKDIVANKKLARDDPQNAATYLAEAKRLKDAIDASTDAAKAGAKVLDAMEGGKLDTKFTDMAAADFQAMQNSEQNYYSGIGRISMALKRLKAGEDTENKNALKDMETEDDAANKLRLKSSEKTLLELIALKEEEVKKMNGFSKLSSEEQLALLHDETSKVIAEYGKRFEADTKLYDDTIKANAEADKKAKEDQVKTINETAQTGGINAVGSANVGRQGELNELQNLYALKLISTENYKKKEAEINAKYDEIILQKTIEVIEKQIEALKAAGVDTTDAEQKLATIKINLADLVFGDKKKKLEDDLLTEEEINRKKVQLAEEIYAGLQGLGNALYESSIAHLDDEKDKIDKRYESEYTAAEGNTKKQKEIKARQLKDDEAIDKQKKKMIHDQAILNKAFAAMDIIIKTAVGAVAQFQAGPGGIVLAALVIAAGAVALATVLAQPVPQAAKGRYNVIGQDDGRSYSAEWGGKAQTGIYARPTLISEAGPELVVDAPTTRNIAMNYPWILSAINHSRVPQFAAGNYAVMGGAPTDAVARGSGVDAQLLAGITEFNANVKNGIRTYVVYDDVRVTGGKIDKIENDVKTG